MINDDLWNAGERDTKSEKKQSVLFVELIVISIITTLTTFHYLLLSKKGKSGKRFDKKHKVTSKI